jgi:hypothetical protein
MLYKQQKMSFSNDSNSDLLPIWKFSFFSQYSPHLKEIIRTILLLNLRPTCLFNLLPRDIFLVLFPILEDIRFPDSILLSHFQQCTLSQWVPKVKEWELLYRASRDGFSGLSFHNRCNFKGPTYSIIKANLFLFGGYTDISWKSPRKHHCKYKNENGKTFIFTITNPYNIPPTQYFLKDMNFAEIYDNSSYGPCFGGNDIRIGFECRNIHDFPISFIDTTRKGRLTFIGFYDDYPYINWEVEELEVFGIQL